MTLKLRNAFLRGWFAARSRRALPAPDGMAEKLYLDNGFDAGLRSAGSALPLLDQVDPGDLRAAWDMEFEIGKSRLQKRYLDVLMPGTGPAVLDLDLRDTAASAHTVEPARTIEDGAPPSAKPKSRWDDDDDAGGDAQPVNHFLPRRGYAPSMARKVRFKG